LSYLILVNFFVAVECTLYDRKMKISTISYLLLLRSAIVSGQRLVTDLFNVDQGTCGIYLTPQANGRPSVLQQFVDESADMVEAGLNMYESATNYGYANAYIVGLLRTNQVTRDAASTILGKKACRSSAFSSLSLPGALDVLTSRVIKAF
jgi:hypothetical protein